MKKIFIICVTLLISACVTIPPNTFVSTPELLKQRQIETRRYDGVKENDLIIAGSNVLQDLGFNLENSEIKLGVLTANKQRDATNGAQVAAAIALALLGGRTPIDKDQTIRVSLIVRPVINSDGLSSLGNHFIRVSFQRIVRRTDNSEYSETVKDIQLYQDFYQRVSKSVFIEAQKI